MDFFEAQARAKRRTTRLVLLFILAVCGTIVAGYAAAMVAYNQTDGFGGRGRSRYSSPGPRPAGLVLWDPQVFLWVAGGASAIIGLASLFKWSEMRAGGSAVAQMVGGRALDPQTRDLRERRLLNIVEEMAIASGLPMPAVYVLDDEPCLNAFAAGLTPNDAVVAVTRGTLEKLTRDELQGVVAHEFSHILNGDMRLNVKLTAIVFGILVIGLIGRGLLRSLGRRRIGVGGGKNKGGGLAALFALGLALMLIGYIGYFFGRLIQAAVSRQREFLADASAVQFTRNPGGIAGALKKIGGYALGGSLQAEKAPQLGHFFFTQGFKSMFGGLWATHPPLGERIRAVEPSWDGQLFEPPEAVDIARESFANAGFGGPRYSPEETVQRMHEAPADIPPPVLPAAIAFQPAAVVANVGALATSHMRHAQLLLDAIPSRVRDASRDPLRARAVVYGLLLGGGRTGREQQAELIRRHDGPEAADALAGLRAALSVVDPAARLPLVQLCAPALRQLDHAALDRFVTTLDELVHADATVTPGEFALQKMLVHHLQLARSAEARRAHESGQPRADDLGLVLSVLARTGSRDDTRAGDAYRAGTRELARPDVGGLLPAADCTLERLDAALDRLALAPLPAKQPLLVAAAHTIGFDGTVTIDEGDLFRAIAAAIDCPVPPLGAAA